MRNIGRVTINREISHVRQSVCFNITCSSLFFSMRYLGLVGRKNIPIPWITAGMTVRNIGSFMINREISHVRQSVCFNITCSSLFFSMRYLGLGGRKNIPIPWITAGMTDSEKYREFHDQSGDITCKKKCLFQHYLFLPLLQHEVSRTGRQKEHPYTLDYSWNGRQ